MCGVAIVSLLWMPGEFIAGDPGAWREETRSLLLRGELNVPAAYAKSFGEPGQYYVRNERNGLYYSKYGLGNVLFALPPMALHKALGGDLASPGKLPNLLLFNLWNVVLVCALTALLYALAARYTPRVGVRIAFVVAALYGTYLWFYERAQSSEIYQVLLFTALFPALVSLLHALAERGRALERRAWRDLSIVWGCVALLASVRIVYGLLLPIIVLLALYALRRGRSWRDAGADFRALAVPILLPPLAIVSLLGYVNVVKFGAPWLTGYHEWRPALHWPTGRLADGVWGLLFSPRFGAFLHFPLLVLALPGWQRFAARHRIDAVAMLAIFVPFFLYVASLPSWAGEWTYGPRYLLFVLPVVSLPAIVFVDELLERPKSWRSRSWALAAAVGLLYSAYLQVQVNRLPFFAYYHLRTVGNSPELVAYFYEHHPGVIADDLLRHRANFDALPFFRDFLDVAPPEVVAEYRNRLAYVLRRPNLYWALAPEERR